LFAEKLNSIIIKIKERMIEALKKGILPELCTIQTVVLDHIIDIKVNGKFADNDISTVYKIMYYYDECANELDAKYHHDGICVCNKVFGINKQSTDHFSYPSIRNSIVKHFECITKLDELCVAFRTMIKNKVGNTEKFKFNIRHPIKFGRGNSGFELRTKLELIAHSDNYVVLIYLVPVLNKLNIYKVLLRALLDNYVIKNVIDETEIGSQNYKKYNGKKILTCIITLNLSNPLLYDFNVNQRCEVIDYHIFNYMFKTFSIYTNDFLDIYKHTLNLNNGNIGDTLKEIYNVCIEENNKFPEYIKSFFYEHKNKFRRSGNSQLDDDEYFVKELNDNLKVSIEDFMDVMFDELSKNYQKAMEDLSSKQTDTNCVKKPPQEKSSKKKRTKKHIK